MAMRFTLRGALIWTFAAALAFGWFADHMRLADRLETAERERQRAVWNRRVFYEQLDKLERQLEALKQNPNNP